MTIDTVSTLFHFLVDALESWPISSIQEALIEADKYFGQVYAQNQIIGQDTQGNDIYATLINARASPFKAEGSGMNDSNHTPHSV